MRKVVSTSSLPNAGCRSCKTCDKLRSTRRAWQLKTNHKRDIRPLVFCWRRLAHRLADGSRRETELPLQRGRLFGCYREAEEKHGCCGGLCALGQRCLCGGLAVVQKPLAALRHCVMACRERLLL